MKKVLIITYYWPPSGGGGVQRWLKFVKYLRDFGWEPVVYTPENGEVPVLDPTLEKEVPPDVSIIKKPITEPYRFYKMLTGQKVQTSFLNEGKKPGLTGTIGTWIRGNLFIPDARCWWINPSVRFLKKNLRSINPDAIVTTGPPHSMHMIGLKLKQKTQIPWIADFRDPWTNIEYYPQLMLSGPADKIHRKLEHKVLTNANRIVTVSPNWAKDFKKMGAKNVDVITNGYDIKDFPEPPPPIDKNFTITHAGFLNAERNPGILWKVLSEMLSKIPELKEKLKLQFIGKTDIAVSKSLDENGLIPYCSKIDYLPHKDAIDACRRSAVLLLLLSDTPEATGRIPGKLFEYLAANRPVICIGPENGDSADIIRKTQSGFTASFVDHVHVKKIMTGLFNAFSRNNLSTDQKNTTQYERRNLTKSMSKILNELTAAKS